MYQILKDDALPFHSEVPNQVSLKLLISSWNFISNIFLGLIHQCPWCFIYPKMLFDPFSLSWLWSGGVCGHQPRVSGVSDDPHTTARVRDQPSRVWFRDTQGPVIPSSSQHITHADTIWGTKEENYLQHSWPLLIHSMMLSGTWTWW